MADDIHHAIMGSSACLKMALSGASMSVGSALWCWLDDNYRVIAALGVVIGAVVGIAGLMLQHRALKRKEAREVEVHAVHIEMLRRQ